MAMETKTPTHEMTTQVTIQRIIMDICVLEKRSSRPNLMLRTSSERVMQSKTQAWLPSLLHCLSVM